MVFGTPAAYLLGTKRFRGAAFLTTLLELPLVLPPAVAGIGLFAAFGRFGLLGGALRAFGIEIPFTQAAVVMALAFVAMPFYMRQAVAAFASMDHRLLGGVADPRRRERAGRSSGCALPLARQGLLAGGGAGLGARAGGVRRDDPVRREPAGDGPRPCRSRSTISSPAANLDGALAISALLVVVSAGLFVGMRVLIRSRRTGDDVVVETSWRSSSVTT